MSTQTVDHVWKFGRNKEDGTYWVSLNGEVLVDSIAPDIDRIRDVYCVDYGFCAREFDLIIEEIVAKGTCTLLLRKDKPPSSNGAVMHGRLGTRSSSLSWIVKKL